MKGRYLHQGGQSSMAADVEAGLGPLQFVISEGKITQTSNMNLRTNK